jgi:hypothetical protein
LALLIDDTWTTGLAQRLVADGERVIDVPAKLSTRLSTSAGATPDYTLIRLGMPTLSAADPLFGKHRHQRG